MRALVTGGSGFVGSHLVDRLLGDGWEVTAVDDLSSGHNVSEGAAFHQLDIRSPDILNLARAFRPDVVFHLAAQASVKVSVSDPALDASINVAGTVNVLEAAKQSGARRIVFTSTGGALYGSGAELPVVENAPRQPESPYGISKLIVEEYFRLYRQAYELDYVLIGPSNIYGPRQDPHGEAGVVAIFTRALLDGVTPTIFGDGSNTRDYIYVSDVVEALMLAVDKGSGAYLNAGTGVETSVNALYRMIAGHVGSDFDPIHGAPRPGDVDRSVLDSTEAERALGWKAQVGLSEGLAKTVEWFRGSG